MGEAFAWGFLAASSLLIGGLIALRRPIGRRTLGLVMAFGSGVLISAVAYELVEEAATAGLTSGGWSNQRILRLLGIPLIACHGRSSDL
jgi:ZIP family zinc transporter